VSAKYKGRSCIKVGFFLMKPQTAIVNFLLSTLRNKKRKDDEAKNRKGR